MDYTNILTNQEGLVLTITINRPKQLNALNKETINELHHALTAANPFKSVPAEAAVGGVLLFFSVDVIITLTSS